MPGSAQAGRGRWKPRLLIGLVVAAGLLLVIIANAHLVHVATSSQPACVPHLKAIDETGDSFRAARSAC